MAKDYRSVWQQRLARQQASGLSVSEFCRQERVSPPSYYRWRKILQGESNGKSPKRDEPTNSMFVPVRRSPETLGNCRLTIELPNGCMVHIAEGTSAALVSLALCAASAYQDDPENC